MSSVTGDASVRRGFILVGVDGSAAAESAVGYAAREADRLGLRLVLLHVIPEVALGTAPGRLDPLALTDIPPHLRERRDRVLGEAATLAHAVLTEDRVTTRMVVGERVPALLSAGEGARTIVLGAPWHSRVDRLITGSVVGGVAARATCPVVGVPEDWTSSGDQGRIVVGVKNPVDPAAEHLVGRAIVIAAERKCRLTVLHAWEFPVVYDNMIATTPEEQAWNRIKSGSLEELVHLARGRHDHVAVDFRIVHGQGAHALVEASTTADLVVISRRRHAFPSGHLGAAGRAVLRESRCPVEVLPALDLVEPADPADR
jgi:nucleotide-binding universal stress UspA family protein